MNDFDKLFLALIPNRYYCLHLDIGTHQNNRACLVPAKHHLYNELARDTIHLTPRPAFFGDCLELTNYFPEKWFDIVTCLDLIEHLRYEDAVKLISDVEQLCDGFIMFFTPYGYFDVKTKEEHHEHLFGWYPKDFVELGYTCLVLPNMHNGFGAFYAMKDFESSIEKFYVASNDEWLKGHYWEG